jgi:curved DNA-binding protein CbpA
MNLRLLPYTPDRDVYRLLGVPSTASNDEIHAACRRLARTFHPDRNGSDRATQEMQVVNAVRHVMTDPETRALYDRERRRFHAELVRPMTPSSARPPRPHVPPRPPVPPRPSTLVRYGRALLRGLGAAAAGLTPRCRGCRAVIDAREDVYCVTCGTPRLTGG